MKNKEFKFSEYAAQAWFGALSSAPKRQIAYADYGDPYDYGIDCAHLIQLENKRYAVIFECGCSCYDYSDASIHTFDTLREARTFWKENKR